MELALVEVELVKLFRALGDPTRLRMVRLLLARQEVACAELQELFPLSRPALAHHTRILQDCGLLAVRKEGAHHFFRLRRECLGPVAPEALTATSR